MWRPKNGKLNYHRPWTRPMLQGTGCSKQVPWLCRGRGRLWPVVLDHEQRSVGWFAVWTCSFCMFLYVFVSFSWSTRWKDGNALNKLYKQFKLLYCINRFDALGCQWISTGNLYIYIHTMCSEMWFNAVAQLYTQVYHSCVCFSLVYPPRYTAHPTRLNTNRRANMYSDSLALSNH